MGTVRMGDMDIRREQALTGSAWVHRRYVMESLLTEQKSAQDQAVGLWNELDPVPP